MRVVKVTPVGKMPVYDVTVDGAEHYLLENGVVTHNTAVTYSANQIFVITKSQEKATNGDLDGWNFNITIHKSRTVREKSKFSMRVMYGDGIKKYSGILDLAVDSGLVQKPKKGYYQLVDETTGELFGKEVKEKATETDEFLGYVLKSEKFKSWVRDTFKLSATSLISADAIEAQFEIDVD